MTKIMSMCLGCSVGYDEDQIWEKIWSKHLENLWEGAFKIIDEKPEGKYLGRRKHKCLNSFWCLKM
jgi:hypothetical protein